MKFRILYRDRKGRTDLLTEEFDSLRMVDAQIKRYCDVWKEPPSMVYATSVVHSVGYSRAYFNHSRTDYIEATREVVPHV